MPDALRVDGGLLGAALCAAQRFNLPFVPAKTKGIRYADDPEADYFLIKELTPGFLDGISGTYKDPVGYFVCEKDPEGFERFEATFPKKEKLKLPGQLC